MGKLSKCASTVMLNSRERKSERLLEERERERERGKEREEIVRKSLLEINSDKQASKERE